MKMKLNKSKTICLLSNRTEVLSHKRKINFDMKYIQYRSICCSVSDPAFFFRGSGSGSDQNSKADPDPDPSRIY